MSITNEEALEVIEQAEARLAQGFDNLAQAMGSILNQYSTQAQITMELLREPFGVEPSPQAQQYKEMIAEQTKLMEESQTDAVNTEAEELEDSDNS